MKKLSSLLFVLLLMLASFTVGTQYPRGDVDQDGKVAIGDVTCLVDYLLTGTWDDEPPVNPDDGQTETITVNGVSFKMVTVEGGSFTMGASNDDETAMDCERPTHRVSVSTFKIAQTEVTQALWVAVMGSNPSNFPGDLNCPVEYVSWNNCQTFITELNALTGKTFRLPTEAEWEYAARGGNMSLGYMYAGSNDINEVAWYRENSYVVGSNTHAVGTMAPNELGLYDISGNVWECCQDWFGDYSSNTQVDPTGPTSGTNRVSRGGCWGSIEWGCRLSNRGYNTPSYKGNGVGLRLAM